MFQLLYYEPNISDDEQYQNPHQKQKQEQAIDADNKGKYLLKNKMIKNLHTTSE